MSETRKRLFRWWPEGYDALGRLSELVKTSGLEPALLELVKMRASQINGCAYCIDVHAKDARASGETEQRLYGLSAWRETSFFSARERAALALTEAITLVADSRVPESLLDDAASEFEPGCQPCGRERGRTTNTFWPASARAKSAATGQW